MRQSTLHILCANENEAKKVKEAAKDCSIIIEHWEIQNHQSVSLYYLVGGEDQEFYDILQDIAEKEDSIRLIEQPVDASFPKSTTCEEQEEEENTPGFFDIISKEEMLNTVTQLARLNGSYLLLVCISTVVATIAIIEGNVAILIGAMVLTPLLGPNLALALSTATANATLAKRAISCGIAGFFLTFIVAYLTGSIFNTSANKDFATMFVAYGFESIVIAICAGLAATILLLQGTLSSLIGVMVAVALMPPLAMTGLALSAGNYHHSVSALLLFAVNIAAFNLAAKTVLLVAGIRPHRSDDKKGRFNGIIIYIFAWLVAISLLSIGIYYK